MIFHRIVCNLLISLALTVGIEAVFAFCFGLRTRRAQVVVLLANVVTNPLLNSLTTVVSFYLSPSFFYWVLVPLEILVVIAEGYIYRSMLRPNMNPLLLSFLLNCCSYVIGTGIIKLIHY